MLVLFPPTTLLWQLYPLLDIVYEHFFGKIFIFLLLEFIHINDMSNIGKRVRVLKIQCLAVITLTGLWISLLVPQEVQPKFSC